MAVGHSFGCLALAHHLGMMRVVRRLQRARNGLPDFRVRGGIGAVWLVAPASPDKFGVRHLLRERPLGTPGEVVGSETDPWMALDEAQQWAEQWELTFDNAGDAGHINAASGHGPWPRASRQVDHMMSSLARAASPHIG